MKPPRTLGLSLAIMASVMLFSILPLLQIAAPLLIQYRLNRATLPLPDGSAEVGPLAVGGELFGISSGELVFQLVSSIVFLGIAIGAWIGRPRWIRTVMVSAVVVLLLASIISSVAALNAPMDLNSGIDSSRDLTATLIYGRLVMSALVSLYVLWYMNRGPARAFYRGYFLQRSEQVPSAE